MASQTDWDELVAVRAPGDTVPVVIRQRGRQVRTGVRLLADPRVEVVPAELAGEAPTEAQRAFRAGWLGGKASLAEETAGWQRVSR